MSAFTSSMRSFMRAAPRAATPTRSFTTSSPRSLARINITGRLGAAPEQARGANGTFVKYNVASSDAGKGNTTSWFRVAAFTSPGQQEFLLTLPKGTLVSVDADIQQKKFTDAEGNERTTFNINQRNIEVLKRGFQQGEGEHTEESSGSQFSE